MKTTSTPRHVSSPRWEAVRRELARRDRESFGSLCSHQGMSQNDQFFHLWQQILVQLAEALGTRQRDVDFERLDELARELEQAQHRGRLPAGLVRKLIPRKRHGSPRKA